MAEDDSGSGFDRKRVEAAVADFLRATGLDPASPELVGTPGFVAQAWDEDLLDGYRQSPAQILADRFPAEFQGLVLLRGARFHAMCPHHLLPYDGIAHIGYLPRSQVVGLSRLVKLLDAFAHRLILQEHIATQVADALMQELDPRGVGVVLEARHGCVVHRSVKRESTIVTHMWRGELETDETARTEFLAAAKEEAR